MHVVWSRPDNRHGAGVTYAGNKQYSTCMHHATAKLLAIKDYDESLTKHSSGVFSNSVPQCFFLILSSSYVDLRRDYMYILKGCYRTESSFEIAQVHK